MTSAAARATSNGSTAASDSSAAALITAAAYPSGRASGGSVAAEAPWREAEWLDGPVDGRQTSVVILGGGPGGYEAALVAAHLGADVTVVDRDGLGGAAVLTDCVPSKTLISTADFKSQFGSATDLGVRVEDHEGDPGESIVADLPAVNARILDLASAQSRDIEARLVKDGVEVIRGTGRLESPSRVL